MVEIHWGLCTPMSKKSSKFRQVTLLLCMLNEHDTRLALERLTVARTPPSA